MRCLWERATHHQQHKDAAEQESGQVIQAGNRKGLKATGMEAPKG
jgi:hypothetical protein